MRIGTRITVITTALVIIALVLYGYVSVRIRRAELRADLERQTQLVGNGLQVSLEAALQEGLYEDVRRLVRRIQDTSKPIGITYLEIKPQPQQRAEVATTAGDGGAPPDGGIAAATAQEEEDGEKDV